MSALRGDYTDCSILLYDTQGNHLLTTKVTRYEKDSLRVELEEHAGLDTGDACRVLILTSPMPCEYLGRFQKEGARSFVAMYQGKEKENRGSVRYKINIKAMIENLICDGSAYPLHTPLEVELINISKSGVRFSAPFYSLSVGDRFQMRMKIGGGEKLLIADTINHKDHGAVSSEYGCKFLIGSENVL